MKLIELHILQSFPVSCLNRDDVGAPKTAVFGGATRARISSQCLKRAIRGLARDMGAELFGGSRTRKAAEDLAAALVEREWKPDAARHTADEVLGLFLAKAPPKAKTGRPAADSETETEQPAQKRMLLYFSPAEIAKMADGIQAARQKAPDAEAKVIKDAAVKALGKGLPKDAADIAIFGRMVANAADVTLEGAGMFSHAISTHKSDNDLDFWTAVDDQKSAGEDAGAANMGTAEFTSACYYRYAALNLGLLADADHLGALTKDERRQVVDAFLRATLMAVPGARKNSMNANTLPAYVLGLAKDKGHPIQLVNAFETPVWGRSGLVEMSVEALRRHYAELKQTWGITAAEEVAIPDATLDALCRRLVAHVE